MVKNYTQPPRDGTSPVLLVSQQKQCVYTYIYMNIPAIIFHMHDIMKQILTLCVKSHYSFISVFC